MLSAMGLLLLVAYPVMSQSLTDQVNVVRQINDQQPLTDAIAIATDTNPSARNFTIPNLWWQQQQQGEAINRRLIDSWRAYDETVSPVPHVDIIVNGQIWPLLSYLEQYAFITQFGESTKSYNYQLRVFIGERLVGLHVCDFIHGKTETTEDTIGQERTLTIPHCKVELDDFG